MVLVHSCPRAVALYCLLTQAGHSLHRKLRFPALCALLSASQTESSLMVPVHSCPRAVALHCLLTQAGHSLMACEKQMSAMQTLVFLYAHNIPEKALYFHIFTDSKSVQIPHRRELHLPLFPFRKRYAAAAQYLKIWRLPSRHF